MKVKNEKVIEFTDKELEQLRGNDSDFNNSVHEMLPYMSNNMSMETALSKLEEGIARINKANGFLPFYLKKLEEIKKIKEQDDLVKSIQGAEE